MDWVCLQLPPELRQEAVRAVEAGRRAGAGGRVRVQPYLLAAVLALGNQDLTRLARSLVFNSYLFKESNFI